MSIVKRDRMEWDAAGNSLHRGDIVIISTLPLFGRAGTIEGFTKTMVKVRVHLTMKQVRIRPESLRLDKLADGTIF